MAFRPSKQLAEQIHAQRRISERFAVDNPSIEYAYLLEQIKTGKSRAMYKQSNRVTVHEVTLTDDRKVAVAYDKHRHAIATVLLHEWALDKENDQYAY